MDGVAEFGSVNDSADNVVYVIKKMKGLLRLCTLIVRSLFDTTAAAAVDVDAPAVLASLTNSNGCLRLVG